MTGQHTGAMLMTGMRRFKNCTLIVLSLPNHREPFVTLLMHFRRHHLDNQKISRWRCVGFSLLYSELNTCSDGSGVLVRATRSPISHRV